MAASRSYADGKSQLIIEFADITTSIADAIVSTDDWRLSMGGGVSRAIMTAAGCQIVLDAAKAVPAKPGSVVVTSAGALPARYVFHAITIGEPGSIGQPTEIIAAATRACLDLLDLLDPLGLDSIAFPAIGAGTAGFPIEAVAVTMAEVIAAELDGRDSALTVTLCLYPGGGMSELDYLAFFEEFRARVPAMPSHESVSASDPAPSSPAAADAPPRIFLSYSHRDREWLERLQTMIAPMLRREVLASWSDTEIAAGARWEGEIRGALDHADVAVLLVSPNFLASNFVADVELPYLLEANRTRGVPIVWLYLSECLYDETAIKDFQAAHPIPPALDALDAGAQNAMLAAACKRIKAAAYGARQAR